MKKVLTLLAATCLCINMAEAKLIDALDDSLWEQSQWISVTDAPVVTGKIRLGHLSAEYKSVAGVIKSAWEYADDGTWAWHVTIPEGATALITLPGEETTQEYTGGSYTFRKVLD